MTDTDRKIRRSPGTNSLVLLGILVVFVVLGFAIWNYWSATNNRPDGDERPPTGPTPSAGASGPVSGQPGTAR